MNDMARRLPPPSEDPQAAGRAQGRETPHRHGLYAVLDIGTNKTACLIARTESDGRPRVLGFGWQKGRGVSAGGISDLEDAERAIRACVGQAEEMADTRLSRVVVNLSCGQPESRLYNVQWPVGGRAVTDDDIRGVVHEGQTRALMEGRQSIHAIPLQFAADGTENIDDPRGLFCDTLGARLHIVDAAATALRSLEACMARCDLEIEELVSAPMAAGLACLVQDERELGATVIDLGGGTTSIAVFADGHLQHTAQLPIGGQHVTKDLATGLSTTLAHAERLKTLYGNVERSPDDTAEMLPVPLVGEEDDHQLARVPRSMVVNIIRPRIEETFEYVKDRLDAAGMTRGGPNQIVLTGGGCLLPGLRDMAGHMLGRRVRIGRPPPLRGLPELASGPAFAVAAGMLIWADGQGRTFQDVSFEPPAPEGAIRRLLKFFKERL